VHFVLYELSYLFKVARGRADNWGTMLQARRSRFRFQMRSLNLFDVPYPSSRTVTLGSTHSLDFWDSLLGAWYTSTNILFYVYLSYLHVSADAYFCLLSVHMCTVQLLHSPEYNCLQESLLIF
jgi:hypothetical protein